MSWKTIGGINRTATAQHGNIPFLNSEGISANTIYTKSLTLDDLTVGNSIQLFNTTTNNTTVGVGTVQNISASSVTGAGTGAKFTVTVAADLSIKVRATVGGTGYVVGDILTFDARANTPQYYALSVTLVTANLTTTSSIKTDMDLIYIPFKLAMEHIAGDILSINNSKSYTGGVKISSGSSNTNPIKLIGSTLLEGDSNSKIRIQNHNNSRNKYLEITDDYFILNNKSVDYATVSEDNTKIVINGDLKVNGTITAVSSIETVSNNTIYTSTVDDSIYNNVNFYSHDISGNVARRLIIGKFANGKTTSDDTYLTVDSYSEFYKYVYFRNNRSHDNKSSGIFSDTNNFYLYSGSGISSNSTHKLNLYSNNLYFSTTSDSITTSPTTIASSNTHMVILTDGKIGMGSDVIAPKQSISIGYNNSGFTKGDNNSLVFTSNDNKTFTTDSGGYFMAEKGIGVNITGAVSRINETNLTSPSIPIPIVFSSFGQLQLLDKTKIVYENGTTSSRNAPTGARIYGLGGGTGGGINIDLVKPHSSTIPDAEQSRYVGDPQTCFRLTQENDHTKLLLGNTTQDVRLLIPKQFVTDGSGKNFYIDAGEKNGSAGQNGIVKIGSGTTSSVEINNLKAIGNIVFEGSIENTFETTLTITEPTQDNTIVLPNAEGTVCVSASSGLVLDRITGNMTFDGSAITSFGSSGNTFTAAGNLTVAGNLIVNGDTTTVNSTTITVDDPIITLGGDSEPSPTDVKDRGVEFRWHNGTAAKLGFFGFDHSAGKFTFIPDAINTSEVFSGTTGTIVANVEGTVGASNSTTGKFTSIEGTSLSLTEGNITNVGSIGCDSITVDDASTGLNLQFNGNTGLNKITLSDNLANALDITDGSNSYMKFVTTNDSEKIEFNTHVTFGTTDGNHVINIASHDLVNGGLKLAGTLVTASATELNILDGVTASTSELNILDGVTASTSELNILDGVTASTSELNILDGVTATKDELNLLDGSSAGTVANSKAVIYSDAGHIAATTMSTTGNITVGDNIVLSSDSCILSFGADSDTTLTHTDGTGLTLNSANKLCFRDNAIHISSDADGYMNIQADTGVNINIGGTDELAINSSTATFGTNIVIPDAGTIGSASKTDAISISSTGAVTFANIVSTSIEAASDYHLTNKLYVDSAITNIGTSGTSFKTNTIKTTAAAASTDYYMAYLTETGTNGSGATIYADNALKLNTGSGVGLNTLTLDGSSFIFKPSTYSTTLSIITPTTSNNISLPNVSGTVITTGDSGTVTNTMLAGSIQDEKISSAATWNNKQNALTFGKSSGNTLISEEDIVSNDVLLMGTNHVIGKTYGDLKSLLSLNNVENTALSTTTGVSTSLADDSTLTVGKTSRVRMTFAPNSTAANDAITITNTDGTGTAAIGLTSTAGGITLTPHLNKVVTVDGNMTLSADKKITIGTSDIISDTSGSTTLSNIDALDDITETTIENAIDTLPNLTTIGISTLTTQIAAGDLTMYNSVNDGNPTISLGSSADNALSITATYNVGNQQLDIIKFATASSDNTADKGQIIFNIDAAANPQFTINDGGIKVGTTPLTGTELTYIKDGKTATGGNSVTGTIPVASGGTNITSYTAGDILYASGTTTLAKLGVAGNNSKALTVNSGGTLGYTTITTDMIADDAVTLAKMAGLASTNIILGDAFGNPSAAALSGDVTMSATGVVSIGSSRITNTMLAGSIEDGKLNTISTADKVSGSAVQLQSNKGIENSNGLGIKINTDKGLSVDANGLATTATTEQLGYLNVSPGTAQASKALVLDSNTDITGLRNLTINGTFSNGNYTFDTNGNVSGLGSIDNGTSNITTSGLLKINIDTSVTPGSTVTGVGGAGSLTLGAGGDAGLYVSSDNLYIENKTTDKDIIFRVNDGGTYTTVATVDGDVGLFNFVASKLAINGTAVTATAADLNAVRAETTQATVTLADADGVVISDVSASNAMKQCLVSDFGTYIASASLTLESKTLTAPKFIQDGYIADSTGAELIKFSQTAEAVNEITITNAATNVGPSITASGANTNIDLSLAGKGTGSVMVNSLKIGSTVVTATGAELNSIAGSKTQKYVYAAPNDSNGAASFRALLASDIPTLNQDTTGNATTVTNGVYTTGDQTIGGSKTFTSVVTGVTPTADAHLATKSYVDSFPISNFTIVNSATLTIASQENEIYHVQNTTKKIALPTNPRIGQKIKLIFDKVTTTNGDTVITPYNINIITTTGTGSGAVISSVIISGGNITSFTLLSGGTGYTNTSTISITVNGTTYTAYTFNNTGDFTDGVLKTTAFTGLNLTLLSGTGVSDGIYSNNVVVNNISGLGSGALISSLVVAADNTITSFILYNGGTGYTNTSTISITVNDITYSTYSITSNDLVGTALKTGVVFSGSLTTTSGSLASGTYNNLVVTLSIAQNGAASVGVNATMLSATVASDIITDFTLLSGGSGFVANNTLTITINGRVYSPYTIVAGDLTNGILKITAFTGLSLSKVSGPTLTDGTYTNTASFKGYVRVHDVEHNPVVNSVFSTLLSQNISLDGTGKGGYGGDILEFLYTGNSIWFVEGLLWSTGSPSPPFS